VSPEEARRVVSKVLGEAAISSSDIRPGFWFYRVDSGGEPQFSRVFGTTRAGWAVQYFRTSRRMRPKPSNRSTYDTADIQAFHRPVPPDLMALYKLDTVPPVPGAA
jgi:hypothetical protein